MAVNVVIWEKHEDDGHLLYIASILRESQIDYLCYNNTVIIIVVLHK